MFLQPLRSWTSARSGHGCPRLNACVSMVSRAWDIRPDDLPVSRNRREKKKMGSRKWNWRGMSTILGVNFGCEFLGGPAILENMAAKIADKFCYQNSLRNSPAIFLNSLDQNIKFTPIRSAEPRAQEMTPDGRRMSGPKTFCLGCFFVPEMPAAKILRKQVAQSIVM